MDSIHLESIEIYAILSAIVWLVIGVIILRYGGRIRMDKNQNIGKAISYGGLAMFVNAALVVYIPDLLLAWMIAMGLFLVTMILVFLYQYKQKKCK